jgi:PIN domain nuclease of toxin-antitoxin system
VRLLLDTQAFIWWDSDPAQLSPAALAALGDPAHEAFLSVWEMAIKAQLGKLTLRLPLADIVAQQQANGAGSLVSRMRPWLGWNTTLSGPPTTTPGSAP